MVVWFFGALALGFCKCCGTQVGGPVCQVQAGRDESSLVKVGFVSVGPLVRLDCLISGGFVLLLSLAARSGSNAGQ